MFKVGGHRCNAVVKVIHRSPYLGLGITFELNEFIITIWTDTRILLFQKRLRVDVFELVQLDDNESFSVHDRHIVLSHYVQNGIL